MITIIVLLSLFFSAGEVESFLGSLSTTEADDGAIYGIAFVSVLGLVMTVVLFSDLVLLGKSLLLLKYNLHLTRTNPFQAPPSQTAQTPARPQVDVPYYIRDFASLGATSTVQATNTPSHFSRIPDWNARKPKRVYMSN